MHISRVRVFCLGMVIAAAAPASAQTWPERVHVSVNGAFQTTTNDFSNRFEFERYLETGSTSVEYPIKGGFVFDAGGGYRLWKNLGVGVAVSYFTREEAAETTSSFPHPFFFNRPREVSGQAPSLGRTETAVHVQAQYLWNPSGPLRIIVSGGPSFVTLEQELVTNVVINESFPFDTATFGSVQTRKEKGSAPTFNIGADVMWMLGARVGVGGILRFSPSSIDLDAPGGRTVTLDAGGLYGGGGVRLLF